MENVQTQYRLDPEKTALVVIDLQNGVVAAGTRAPYSCGQVVVNAAKLAEAFMDKGMFVVFVRVSTHDGKDMLRPKLDFDMPQRQLPAGWDEIVPELKQFEGAYIVTKRNMGAFFGTDLDLQLRRRGIDTIVLCGISTAIGVDTTAREAHQHGYNQIFVEDAMTASEREEHEHVTRRILPRMGRIRTTDDVIGMLG